MTEPQEKDERLAALEQLAVGPRRKLKAQIAKHQKLIANLQSDAAKHGDADKWKRFGDLILANTYAERRGDTVIVMDYFDEATPVIEIEGDRNKPLTEIAEGYFRRYVKARNAAGVIAERMATTEAALEKAKTEL